MPLSYIDSNIDHYDAIFSPRDLRGRYPADQAVIEEVTTTRSEIQRILAGDSAKIMLIVGPCSIHKPDEAIEYAGRLHTLTRQVEDTFLVVLRTYFEKSRTGLGWKGLIDEPDLDGKSNMGKGLQVARKLLLDINAIGMPCATELVDPITPQYILDLVVWSAIGARSVESRRSRELASGISTPVGFKNRTDGNIDVAVEALNYAREAHSFSGITEEGKVAEIKTRGNKFGHIILRGGSNGPNYDVQHVAGAQEKLRRRGLPDVVMIDCSHANSNKDHTKQPGIFLNVIDQICAGNRKIFGIMLESYLQEGKQPYGAKELRRGVSITDACLSFEDTEAVILEAHRRLNRR
jgi:3-deoxy-7-phosphoheptulonate synthase